MNYTISHQLNCEHLEQSPIITVAVSIFFLFSEVKSLAACLSATLQHVLPIPHIHGSILQTKKINIAKKHVLQLLQSKKNQVRN